MRKDETHTISDVPSSRARTWDGTLRRASSAITGSAISRVIWLLEISTVWTIAGPVGLLEAPTSASRLGPYILSYLRHACPSGGPVEPAIFSRLSCWAASGATQHLGAGQGRDAGRAS